MESEHDTNATPDQPQRQLVPTTTAIMRWEELPQDATCRPVCTWPLDTVEGRAKLHQIICGGSVSLWDACEATPIEIAVEQLAAHFTSFEPEDGSGDLVAGPMLSLIGPETIYHSGSEHVYRSIQQLMMLEGPPPWHPFVKLRISRERTRNRRMRCVVAYIGRG